MDGAKAKKTYTFQKKIIIVFFLFVGGHDGK